MKIIVRFHTSIIMNSILISQQRHHPPLHHAIIAAAALDESSQSSSSYCSSRQSQRSYTSFVDLKNAWETKSNAGSSITSSSVKNNNRSSVGTSNSLSRRHSFHSNKHNSKGSYRSSSGGGGGGGEYNNKLLRKSLTSASKSMADCGQQQQQHQQSYATQLYGAGRTNGADSPYDTTASTTASGNNLYLPKQHNNNNGGGNYNGIGASEHDNATHPRTKDDGELAKQQFDQAQNTSMDRQHERSIIDKGAKYIEGSINSDQEQLELLAYYLYQQKTQSGQKIESCATRPSSARFDKLKRLGGNASGGIAADVVAVDAPRPLRQDADGIAVDTTTPRPPTLVAEEVDFDDDCQAADYFVSKTNGQQQQQHLASHHDKADPQDEADQYEDALQTQLQNEVMSLLMSNPRISSNIGPCELCFNEGHPTLKCRMLSEGTLNGDSEEPLRRLKSRLLTENVTRNARVSTSTTTKGKSKNSNDYTVAKDLGASGKVNNTEQLVFSQQAAAQGRDTSPITRPSPPISPGPALSPPPPSPPPKAAAASLAINASTADVATNEPDLMVNPDLIATALLKTQQLNNPPPPELEQFLSSPTGLNWEDLVLSMKLKKRKEESLLNKEIIVLDDDEVSAMGSTERLIEGGMEDGDEEMLDADKFVGDDRFMGNVVTGYLNEHERDADEDSEDDSEDGVSIAGSSISSKSICSHKNGNDEDNILNMSGVVNVREVEFEKTVEKVVTRQVSADRAAGDVIPVVRERKDVNDGLVEKECKEEAKLTKSPLSPRKSSRRSPPRANRPSPKRNDRLEKKIEMVITEQQQEKEQQTHQPQPQQQEIDMMEMDMIKDMPNPFKEYRPPKKISPLSPPPPSRQLSSKSFSSRRAQWSRSKSDSTRNNLGKEERSNKSLKGSGSRLWGLNQRGTSTSINNSSGRSIGLGCGSAFSPIKCVEASGSAFSPTKASLSAYPAAPSTPILSSPTTPKTAMETPDYDSSPEQFTTPKRSKSVPLSINNKELVFSPIEHHPNTTSTTSSSLQHSVMPLPISPKARRSSPQRSTSCGVVVVVGGSSSRSIGGCGNSVGIGNDPRDVHVSPRIRALSAAARRRVNNAEREHHHGLLHSSADDRLHSADRPLHESSLDPPILLMASTLSTTEDDLTTSSPTDALLNNLSGSSSMSMTRGYSESIMTSMMNSENDDPPLLPMPSDDVDDEEYDAEEKDDGFYDLVRGRSSASSRCIIDGSVAAATSAVCDDNIHCAGDIKRETDAAFEPFPTSWDDATVVGGASAVNAATPDAAAAENSHNISGPPRNTATKKLSIMSTSNTTATTSAMTPSNSQTQQEDEVYNTVEPTKKKSTTSTSLVPVFILPQSLLMNRKTASCWQIARHRIRRTKGEF